MNTFHGHEVVLNSNLVKEIDGAPVTVARTWKERLLSRPWRPLQSTRTYVPKVRVPSGEVYMMGNKIVMHPAYWERVRKGMELDRGGV